MAPLDPGTFLKPTIMNTRSFEAGGDLSTPVDPDNVNSLSLLLKTPSKHYSIEGLAKMIKDFGNKHSHFLGIKNLENNMHSLVTAVIKLGGINPMDPERTSLVPEGRPHRDLAHALQHATVANAELAALRS